MPKKPVKRAANPRFKNNPEITEIPDGYVAVTFDQDSQQRIFAYVPESTGTETSPPTSPPTGGGGNGSASVNDFLLTLAPGKPLYRPYPATPSSTNTSAETVTVANNWVSGTIATVSASGGGLTAATEYYLNVSGTTVSFHTTVADAIAGTNKADLTASITAEIRPVGITNTTLYFSPWRGNSIGIYDGASWDILTSAEISIALGTLTADRNYDVFVYSSGGMLTIDSLVAWTDDTTRATNIVRQDGIWVKSGALTRRYVGTIRTNSTTTTIDSAGGVANRTGGKRFVYNANGSNKLPMFVYDTSDWTYQSTTIRQANGQAGNKVEWVDGLGESIVDARVVAINSTSTTDFGSVLVGLNQITLQEWGCDNGFVTIGVSVGGAGFSSSHVATLSRNGRLGYNYAAWLEVGKAAVSTQTWLGERLTGSGFVLRSGLTAVVEM